MTINLNYLALLYNHAIHLVLILTRGMRPA
jgi:hypothetical protein